MLARAGIVVALFAPALAFAAYNDVSLTTDTVLSVNGITLNVSGSSAAVASITVDSGNFNVTLSPSSTFEVTAPNLNQLSGSTNTGLAKDICTATQSVLGYAPTSGDTYTVTISPSATLCSSGGGGGSAPATPATPATPSGGGGGAAPATPATPATPAAPATPASGLTAGQIQAILDVLASFDADAETIAKVKASLEGTPVQGSVTSTAVAVFKANLTIGSLGSEVKALQEFLNARGYTIAASGPGSPGNETTRFGALTKAALIKYQKAKGIKPAVGYFGPLTRAAVNAGQ